MPDRKVFIKHGLQLFFKIDGSTYSPSYQLDADAGELLVDASVDLPSFMAGMNAANEMTGLVPLVGAVNEDDEVSED